MFGKDLNLSKKLRYRDYHRLSLILTMSQYRSNVVGLSQFYLQKFFQVNISIQYKVMAQKGVLYTRCGQSAILHWISTKIQSVLPLV